MMMGMLFLSIGLALPKTIPVSEVKKGMTGECLTVFEGAGDHVEPFGFVVKGVMPGALGPGRDLVMVRLVGEKAEFTGVVAGMSGSPCSIEGRLLGALSYRFGSFTKQAIGGITPVADMAKVLELPRVLPPWRRPRAALTGAARKGWSNQPENAASERSFSPVPAREGLVPVSAPLAMSGVPPEVQRHFADFFDSMNFTPTVGSGGFAPSESGDRPQRLVPGGAVSMVFLRGDVNMGALCTVTTVEKNSVTACGHPVLGSGPISIPMGNATVLNTLASTQGSVKQFTTGPLVGEFSEDRLTAIAGRTGRIPQMVPVKGSIQTPTGTERFSFEAARDLALTPRYVAVGLASALAGRVEASQRGLVRVAGRVNIQGEEPIVFEEVYSGERDPRLWVHSAINAAQHVAAVWNTDFGPPPELGVEITAKVESEPIEEFIEDVFLDQGVVRAGSTFKVSVELRRMNESVEQGVEYETFSVKAPTTWAGNTVQVVAASARPAQAVADRVEGPARAQNLSQVVSILNRQRGGGYLYLMVVRDAPGLKTQSGSYGFLPPSAAATLAGGSLGRTSRTQGIALERRRKRPGSLSGAAKLTLKVEPSN